MSATKFNFPIIIIDEDFRAENSSGLGIRALAAAGFTPELADVTMKPEGENVFSGDDAIKMQKLLDALENLDDVQEIYTTAIIEE